MSWGENARKLRNNIALFIREKGELFAVTAPNKKLPEFLIDLRPLVAKAKILTSRKKEPFEMSK